VAGFGESRGQAASTRRRTQWRKRREASAALVLAFFCKLWILLENSCRLNILELG
jgi:hypothetical protein